MKWQNATKLENTKIQFQNFDSPSTQRDMEEEEEEEEDLISQFKSLTGADDDTAKCYLLRSNPRNLQAAVNSFFDERTKRTINETSHRTFYVSDVEDIGDKGREGSLSLMRGVSEEHKDQGIRALVLGSFAVNMKAAMKRMESLFRDEIPIFLVHGDKSVSSLQMSTRKSKWKIHLKHLVRNEVEQSPVKNRIQKANEERRAGNAWSCNVHLNFMARYIECFLGCHHSKYALMFCENHLRIAITTQNLKNGYVTDVCWFSPRIPLRRKGKTTLKSDWCNALSNYMKCTDEALVWNAEFRPDSLPSGYQDHVPLTVRDFMSQHRPSLVLNKESETFWKDLFGHFCFETLDREGPSLVCSVCSSSRIRA